MVGGTGTLETKGGQPQPTRQEKEAAGSQEEGQGEEPASIPAQDQEGQGVPGGGGAIRLGEGYVAYQYIVIFELLTRFAFFRIAGPM